MISFSAIGSQLEQISSKDLGNEIIGNLWNKVLEGQGLQDARFVPIKENFPVTYFLDIFSLDEDAIEEVFSVFEDAIIALESFGSCNVDLSDYEFSSEQSRDFCEDTVSRFNRTIDALSTFENEEGQVEDLLTTYFFIAFSFAKSFLS